MSAREEEKVHGEIRSALAGFPGVQSEVLTFLGDRIGETIAGETAQVSSTCLAMTWTPST